jgi:hypothetical protein
LRPAHRDFGQIGKKACSVTPRGRLMPTRHNGCRALKRWRRPICKKLKNKRELTDTRRA